MTDIDHDTAEKHVLGALMQTRTAIDETTTILDPTDFHAPRHETIYTTITALASRGDGVDPITVANELTRRGELTAVGGALYLADLYATPPTAANVGYYARIVHDQATLRRLHTACTRGTQLALTQEGDPAETVALVQAEIEAIGKHGTTPAGWLTDDLDTVLETLDTKPLITPTQWAQLNSLIGGWAPGRLYVIGARPAVGKTMLSINIAVHIAKTLPVTFASLEMSKAEITHRVMALMTGIPLTRITGHTLTETDHQTISHKQPDLRALLLATLDDGDLTVPSVIAHARAIARRSDHPLGAVIIDYLQLMTSKSRSARGHENRQVEVAEMSRALKRGARTLDAPVIALSQLNRSIVGRGSSRPTMSDLRESGAIEQDADVVILLHVEDDDPATLHVGVAKNRHGPTGALTLHRDGALSRISSRTMLAPTDDRARY
jgi:replicative DNA helicase